MSSAGFPIVMTSAGYQPRTPAQLRGLLLASVSLINPGYTADLPGGLIEDIASTDVGAMSQMETGIAEIINSVSPDGASEFILPKLGGIYGVPAGKTSNGSAYLIFSGPQGFVIAQGFTVSDGTYQYVCSQGGVIGTGGVSLPIFCVATVAGTWPIGANSITQLVTGTNGVAITVTNPLAGNPGGTAQPYADYRAQVLQAGLAAAQGMGRFLKTLLGNIPGTVRRLISVRQSGTQWEVICGGGDPIQVGYAIWMALFDVNSLVGSTIAVTAITNAANGLVTTNLNHGYSTGQLVQIAGVTPGTFNGAYTINVPSPTTFRLNVDTTGFGAYVSGGVVTPNFRNITTQIIDYPDTYVVPFVSPPLDNVTIGLVWNTSSPFAVAASAVEQLGTPALIAYINSVPVGQLLNQMEMENVFVQAVASLIPPPLLTRMVWTVSINGVGVSLLSGTRTYPTDPESGLTCNSTNISIVQG
jgi:hypothetical protein